MTKTPQPKNALKGVRMPDSLVKAVNEWRRAEPDIPSWGEAVRRLLELGLQQAQSRQTRDRVLRKR